MHQKNIWKASSLLNSLSSLVQLQSACIYLLNARACNSLVTTEEEEGWVGAQLE